MRCLSEAAGATPLSEFPWDGLDAADDVNLASTWNSSASEIVCNGVGSCIDSFALWALAGISALYLAMT